MSMQMQQSAQAEYHFGAEVFSLDTVSQPDRAEKWVRMCSNTPALMKGFQELFLAAQLTLLGHGQHAMLAGQFE